MLLLSLHLVPSEPLEGRRTEISLQAFNLKTGDTTSLAAGGSVLGFRVFRVFRV